MNKENAKQNIASGMSSTIGAAVGVVAGTMASNEMHAAESDEATVTDATPAEETADEDVPVVDVDPAQAPAAEPAGEEVVAQPVAQPVAEPTAQPAAEPATPQAQPAGQTPEDVQVLDYQTVDNGQGGQADVAVITDGTTQAVVIDADRDGIADVMAVDQNHDGQLSDNEIINLEGHNVAMQPLQEMAHANDPNDGMMAQNASYEPDYVNDANVDGYVEA